MTPVITVTTQPIPDPKTSTPTHYQEVAANLIAALDAFVAIVPKIDEAETSDAKRVRRNLNVPDVFCHTAIAVAEQSPELESAKANAELNRNRLQFLEAFRVVDDKLDAVSSRLKHALFAVKSEVASQALEVYRVVRARMKRNPALAPHAEVLKRDLGRRFKTKAEREERKARKFNEAVEQAVALRLGVKVLTQEQKEAKAA